MNVLGNEEIVFEMGRDRLPKVRKWTRILLRWYALGIKWLEPFVKRRLKFSDQVGLQPGVDFKSGQVFCEGHAHLSDTLFVDYAPVYIGEDVGFAFRNIVVTSHHDPENFKRVIARPVIIERNVWITTNVTILGGVRIGENSIIGAGSVVTKDIPPNVFAAGNPCVPLKQIARDHQRKEEDAC